MNEAPAPTKTQGASGVTPMRKFSARCTSTEAQLHRVLTLLRLRPHHTYEFRSLGISHPAARVKNLIERGFVIASSRITTVDPEGYVHSSVALYELTGEPALTAREVA